ncbi:50S ribosomal protein L19, chloroplastic [Linum perenne]
MRSLFGALIGRHKLGCSSTSSWRSTATSFANFSNESRLPCSSAANNHFLRSFHHFASGSLLPSTSEVVRRSLTGFRSSGISSSLNPSCWNGLRTSFPIRNITTAGAPAAPASPDSSIPSDDLPPRIKFKRMDKTARHIMQILNREAVGEVRAQREVLDIRPGYIVQLKVVFIRCKSYVLLFFFLYKEVPENKRRLSTVKGIVIARRNAGINSTFRIRRQVGGVGVESLFMLYSPNIKEVKVLEKKKVRRAKLYYLREKMNALSK